MIYAFVQNSLIVEHALLRKGLPVSWSGIGVREIKRRVFAFLNGMFRPCPRSITQKTEKMFRHSVLEKSRSLFFIGKADDSIS